jgi:hypothetical protein
MSAGRWLAFTNDREVIMLSIPKPGPLPSRYVGPGKLIEPGRTILQTKTALKKAGFEVIGMGQSQVALSKPKGRRVIKLSAGRATGGWDAIEMFRAHPEIDEFPRVFAAAALRDGAWAVEMERLKKDRGGEHGWEITMLDDDDEPHEVIANTWGAHIADAFGEHWDGHIDLHDDNWMLRGDTAVITDPFNSWGGIREHSTRRALQQIGTLAFSKEGFWSSVH